MQESQDSKEVLSKKLHEYEADVPDSSGDVVFSRIGTSSTSGTGGRKVLYAVIALFVAGGYFVVDRFNGSEHPNSSRSDTRKNSVSENITKEKDTTDSYSQRATVATSIESTVLNRGDKNESKDFTVSKDIQTRNTLSGATIQKSGEKKEQRNSDAYVFQREVSDDQVSAVSNDKLNNQSNVAADLSARDSVKSEKNLIVKDEVVKEVDVVKAQNVDSTTTPRKSQKLHLTANVFPFLNFRRIVPIGTDAASLSKFETPAAFSSQRMGVKVSLSADYEIGHNRFVYGGVSYFTYTTSFSYNSNEEISNVLRSNAVNETVQGMSVFFGGRYPLKISQTRKQYLSAGIDGQFLSGSYFPGTSHTQFMINAGYTNDFYLSEKRYIRIQPTVTYSITKFNYGGLTSQPFWIGFEIGYGW